MARRLRSAAARRREARFCGWLARGLWAGLHAAIIAVTLSANKGVAARIHRDMPYAASLAGVLAANVALFLYLCAADPGYVPVTDRRLGGSKQAALGGAVAKCSRRQRVLRLANGKADAVNGDPALLPVWQPPNSETHSEHMLAGASMLFESSFPDQVMLPAPASMPPPPGSATARHPRDPAASSAQPSSAATALTSEAAAVLHPGRPAVKLKHATSAPAATREWDSKSTARQPQLALIAQGNIPHAPAGGSAAASAVHKPTIIRNGDLKPVVAAESEPAPLGSGHLLSGRGVEEDLEEQPLLPDPGAFEIGIDRNRPWPFTYQPCTMRAHRRGTAGMQQSQA